MNPRFPKTVPDSGAALIQMFFVVPVKLHVRRVEVLISRRGSGFCPAMAHQNHGPQMLTANRLVDGDVLYRKGDGWVLTLADGEVYADEAAANAALAAAQAEATRNIFVGAYLFEVRVEKGVITPVKEREIIRASGPTVRPDLGKQAAHG
jgi:hypothetical protein